MVEVIVVKRWIAVALVAGILALLTVGLGLENHRVSAQPAGPPGRFLVFTDGDPAVNAAVRNRAQQRGGRPVDEIRVAPGLGLVVAEVPGAVVAELAGIPGVREVSPDQPPSVPGHNPNASEQLDWGVDRIEADKVWSNSPATGIGPARSVSVSSTATVTGSGVVVAVTDTGVQLDHSDLAANTQGPIHANCSGDGECTTSGGALAPGSAGYDNNGDGHGSGVAGIIAAVDNEIGTIGVSPRATILSVNCFEPATFFSCLRAVRYAGGLDQNGNVVSSPRASVVNMSWGWDKTLETQCPSCVTTINAIMEEAWGRGLLLVAAAGNAGNCQGSGDNIIIPGRLDKPMPVAATQSNDVRACFSSTGPSLAGDGLAAPGASVESPWFGGYTTWNGTSAATPHASGVGALVLSKDGTLTNGQVKNLLLRTAQDLGASGADSQYGLGLVRADQATGTGSVSPPPSGSMHVGDLDGTTAAAKGKNGKWSATVTVTVHDGSHGAVGGAAVSGQWKDTSGNVIKTASGTTNSSGQLSLGSGSLSGLTSITFCVTNVTGTLTYDAAANHDPDGDSNGTCVTVNKP